MSHVVSESPKAHPLPDMASCLLANTADLAYIGYPAYLANPAIDIDLAYLTNTADPANLDF